MKHESFEEFINRVSDDQHQNIDNYDEFMTNLRRCSEYKEMRDIELRDIEADRLRRESEKEMKSAKRLAIAAVVLNVIALGLHIFRFIMRATGVWE